MDKVKCAKCGKEMECGNIRVPGVAVWSPLKRLLPTNSKTLYAYACHSCGYTETYIKVDKEK